jgi:hypothetical protein
LGSQPESGERSKLEGPARKWIALAVLAALAGLAWGTIDPGRVRLVVLLLLAVFALRIVLTRSGFEGPR